MGNTDSNCNERGARTWQPGWNESLCACPQRKQHFNSLAILDREGIAVRAGHHCAQPVMQHYGLPATVRASFGLYNTMEEVDRLADGIARVQQMFS